MKKLNGKKKYCWQSRAIFSLLLNDVRSIGKCNNQKSSKWTFQSHVCWLMLHTVRYLMIARIPPSSRSAARTISRWKLLSSGHLNHIVIANVFQYDWTIARSNVHPTSILLCTDSYNGRRVPSYPHSVSYWHRSIFLPINLIAIHWWWWWLDRVVRAYEWNAHRIEMDTLERIN